MLEIVVAGVSTRKYGRVIPQMADTVSVRQGASENAEVTRRLLEDLAERGLDPTRRRLFVIDGGRARRKAIDQVFGQGHPIQICRNHEIRDVLAHLPKDQHPQVKAAIRAEDP